MNTKRARIRPIIIQMVVPKPTVTLTNTPAMTAVVVHLAVPVPVVTVV